MIDLIANDKKNITIIDEKKPIYILISSLSLGGAEKIIVDWASSEAARKTNVEVAILHSKLQEHKFTSSNITLLRRNKNISVSTFLTLLAERWGNDCVVSTHLISLDIHKFLWSKKISTIPVIHNDLKGWKFNPNQLNNKYVPAVVACADYVKTQIIESGYNGEVFTIRHQPIMKKEVFNYDTRTLLRKKFMIDDNTLIVGAIGAIKHQKNYHRIIEIAKQTNRKIQFLIFGDAVNNDGKKIKKELFSKIKEFNLFDKIIFMGFKDDIFKYYPLFDVVINCSDYEGYSIATQEALLSDIPVIATNVSGQSEIKLPNLKLINKKESNSEFIEELMNAKIRKSINKIEKLNTSRIWSISLIDKNIKKETSDIMFLTANLNAGGAQRSLINLTTSLNKKANISIAVCNESSNDYFSNELEKNNVDYFQLSNSRDVFDLTRVLIQEVYSRNIKTLCLWNVDPKMKLLISEFLPKSVKYIDVSPGGYAFEELENTKDFQEATTYNITRYYNRLNKLILKYDADISNIKKYNIDTEVIRNGVEFLNYKDLNIKNKDILVSGRIVESKHILSIIKAFKIFNKNNNNEYSLNFYGQSEKRNIDYLNKVKEISQNEKIIFHGADPKLLFMKKDFCMTIVLGTHQGCPNAVLEAAANCIPIIANDSGGTREIIKNKHSGLLISEDFELNELVLSMNNMLELNRNEIITNAKKIIDNYFSIEKMTINYSKILL